MSLDRHPTKKRAGRSQALDNYRGVRFADPDDFRRIAESFTERELRQLLGVTAERLARWLGGQARIPWACYQLALERSPYGLRERDEVEGFNRRMLEGLNQALKTRIEYLEREIRKQARLVQWGSANDPFILPSDPRSQSSD